MAKINTLFMTKTAHSVERISYESRTGKVLIFGACRESDTVYDALPFLIALRQSAEQRLDDSYPFHFFCFLQTLKTVFL